MREQRPQRVVQSFSRQYTQIAAVLSKAMRIGDSRLAPLAVAAMLAVSGCAAFGSGGSESETLTPVSVPSPTQTATDSPTATPESTPATDTLRIFEIAQLGSRYESRLENDSYRLRATDRLRVDGSVVAATTLTRRVADTQLYIERLNRTNDGLGGTNISYTNVYNGSVSATRITNDATPTYTFTADPRPPDDLAGRGELEGLLRVFAVERERNTTGAATATFVSNRIRSPGGLGTPLSATDPRNGTLRLRLYRNGTTRLRASYTVTVGGNRTGEVTRTFRVDRVGNVSVSTPQWLETARAQ
jgi:hypothetical protein